VVRPTEVFEGEICGMPAWLRIGQRDLRTTGVELTEVDDRRLVADRLAGVLRGLVLVGRAGVLRGRVVQRDVLDREVADLAADLLERELLAVDHGLALPT
jgi:hypothetical protein